jgi:hypothetical protein
VPAALVVFLVALPLCLGIALASGAPLLSGIVAGVVGGIVVGAASGSHLMVSGPAAGLTAIVLAAVQQLGGFARFLPAVVLGGMLQLILGAARAGIIGYYFPSAVIKGMLAAIGLILILKQIPHALGYDADFEGDFAFREPSGGDDVLGAGARPAADPGRRDRRRADRPRDSGALAADPARPHQAAAGTADRGRDRNRAQRALPRGRAGCRDS